MQMPGRVLGAAVCFYGVQMPPKHDAIPLDRGDASSGLPASDGAEGEHCDDAIR